jgi:hypothetical protein
VLSVISGRFFLQDGSSCDALENVFCPIVLLSAEPIFHWQPRAADRDSSISALTLKEMEILTRELDPFSFSTY